MKNKIRDNQNCLCIESGNENFRFKVSKKN